MADAPSEKPPKLRCESPSSDNLSVPPTSTRPELTRCVSTASSVSHTSSAITDASVMRESLGSDISAFSRHSSGSYQSSRPSDVCSNTTASTLSSPRNSTGGFEATRTVSGSSRRRGFMRPQGTDFAASARSRESVLNLGSIAHLQYYFARTGLLDGKGGQMARNRNYKAQTLDLSSLESTACSTADLAISDVDSSYASLGSSPEVASSSHGKSAVIAGHMVESPVEEQQYEEFDWDEYEEPDPTMLPPTVSTYRYREKPLPKPPSIAELKADLTSALDAASRALAEAKDARVPTPSSDEDGEAKMSPAASWYEIQGMHILDVMTLAIRAAKVYYTAHEQPDRLDAIKPEKQLRSELLTVMDVLKRMATRLFGGGLRSDEFTAMDSWIDSVRNMLAAEEQMEAAEAAERASWTWLRDEGWDGREYEREYAFIRSMLASGSTAPFLHPSTPTDPNHHHDTPTSPTTPTTPNLPPTVIANPTPATTAAAAVAATAAAVAAAAPDPLPPWTPIDRTIPPEEQRESLPTPFLAALRSGLRLVHLHNCAVRRSRRRFGAIATFHADTQKPYRAADNLRYWAKAAELRWEVGLRLDALAVVYGDPPSAWLQFEDAVLAWCRKVREEITAEVRDAGGL